jgi:branched-chain amino acid aminotransferase
MTTIVSKFVKNEDVKNISEFNFTKLEDDVVVYEVIRILDGKVLFFEDHIERFLKSLKQLSINNAFSGDNLRQQLALLISSNQIPIGNIRFQLIYNKGTKSSDFMAYFIPHFYPTEEMNRKGVSVGIIQAQRTMPNAKIQHSNLIEEVNQALEKEKVYEVILVHPQGYVTEGSRSNLFMIKNNQIFTSPIKDILPGVTRKYIIQICNSLNLDFYEKRVDRNELLTMDALFISGTSPKVLPIRNIYDEQFNVNHPILKSIITEFDNVISRYLETSPKIL